MISDAHLTAGILFIGVILWHAMIFNLVFPEKRLKKIREKDPVILRLSWFLLLILLFFAPPVIAYRFLVNRFVGPLEAVFRTNDGFICALSLALALLISAVLFVLIPALRLDRSRE